jgi:hypothetical protein
MIDILIFFSKTFNSNALRKLIANIVFQETILETQFFKMAKIFKMVVLIFQVVVFSSISQTELCFQYCFLLSTLYSTKLNQKHKKNIIKIVSFLTMFCSFDFYLKLLFQIVLPNIILQPFLRKKT